MLKMSDEYLWQFKLVNMITLPDFKQKQALFIQTERNAQNRIKFQNDNIVFLKDDKVVNRASCHRVFAVFVIGDISITSELMKQGTRYGVSFFFLKPNFDLYASVNASAEGNYLLKMRQYAMAEKEELGIAKKIVQNKIKNQLRLVRSRRVKAGLPKRETEIMSAIEKAAIHDSLRGIEGNVSKEFFSAYFEPLGWKYRMPRVKADVPNFLLDVGYTMMFNILDSLLRLYGFDTYKGCYHKLFFQRKSLTCDVVEPFRPLIDREVLKIFTLNQIGKGDFQIRNGRVVCSFQTSARYAQVFLEAIMKNREDIYRYVQGFYRFVMNSEKNAFPEFIISR